MKFLILLTFFISFTADAGYQRFDLDPKWPTDKSIHLQVFVSPAQSATTTLKSALALTNSAVATVTSFLAQPDVPRNIVLTTTGTGANVGAGTAVVAGTDFFNNVISENFTIAQGISASVTGAVAFKTVTSVQFPAPGTSVSLNIGIGNKLGLDRCLANPGDFLHALINGLKDIGPQTNANSAAVSLNTVIFSSALNSSNKFDFLFFHNYRCQPSR